jgi:hypothetical protein
MPYSTAMEKSIAPIPAILTPPRTLFFGPAEADTKSYRLRKTPRGLPKNPNHPGAAPASSTPLMIRTMQSCPARARYATSPQTLILPATCLRIFRNWVWPEAAASNESAGKLPMPG